MAAAPRNTSIDLLRGFAAFGIVWFHAGAPRADAALSGLTVFFLLLVLFHPPGPLSPVQVAKSRADRLLRPWWVWSAIFAVAKTAQAMHAHRPILDEFAPWMLMSGSALHLWFLPFAFVLLLAITLVETRISLQSLPAYLLFLGLSLVAMPLALHLMQAALGRHPWVEWAAAIGPILPAMALRATASSGQRQALLFLAVLLSWALARLIGFDPGPAVPIGLALTLLALTFPRSDHPFNRWVGQMSMPVYLIHPFFLSLLGLGWEMPGALAAILATALAAMTGELIVRMGLAKALL